MYDTSFELQMLRTLHPTLLSTTKTAAVISGARRAAAARPRNSLTTRRLFGLVQRFAAARARDA